MPKTKPNAFLHRIHVRLGFALALVGGLPVVGHAAYANLTPPPGWVQGGGAVVAGPGGAYAAQTTANQWIANASKSSAMLNVGGKQQAVNVAMKLAPNAGKVAAAFLYLNPGLRTAVGIASWLGLAKVFYDSASGKWNYQDPEVSQPSDGFEYKFSDRPWFSSAQSSCADWGQAYAARTGNSRLVSAVATGVVCKITTALTKAFDSYPIGHQFIRTDYLEKRAGPCPVGWYKTPAGCSQTPTPRVLTQQEMADLLNPDNTPGWPSPTTPNEFPKISPFPIQLPIINPSTGVNPFPKPFFSPTGDPVRNPQYDPTKAPSDTNRPWKQPGTTVTPSPTPGNPWRVDLQPTDRLQDGPEPVPETETPADADPANDKPKPEETQSLCEKHPDILACAKPELDTPEEDIPKSNKEVTLTEENLFGAGSCPADVYFQPSGGLQQMKAWDWNQSCGYISSYVKPILILCCTFTAFMILVPGKTE